MQKLIKKIKSFHDEKYRDLPYGRIYYVASAKTPELNEYVKANADQIAEQINNDADTWITCRIVYLDESNHLFHVGRKAALYSAMLPFDGLNV